MIGNGRASVRPVTMEDAALLVEWGPRLSPSFALLGKQEWLTLDGWLGGMAEPGGQRRDLVIVGDDGNALGLVRVTVTDRKLGKFALHVGTVDPERIDDYAAAARAVIDYLFDEEHAHKVSSSAFADDQASTDLMERVGMRREVVYREQFFMDGEYRDVVSYAVRREEVAKP